MVTGGFDENTQYLDLTGIYTEVEGWRIVSGRLPVALRSPAIVNYNNRVVLFGIIQFKHTHRQKNKILGGNDGPRDYKFIYEYNPNEETWTKIGDMTMDRFNFAASVVPLSDFKDHFVFCLSN